MYFIALTSPRITLDKRRCSCTCDNFKISVCFVFFSHNLIPDEDEEEEDEAVVEEEKDVHKNLAPSGGENTGLLSSQPAPLPLPPEPVQNTSS